MSDNKTNGKTSGKKSLKKKKKIMRIVGLALSAVEIIAAIVFGKRKGAIAGAFGMGLFDLLSEWAIWAPFTFVVRGVMGYIIGSIAWSGNKKGESIKTNIFAIIISGVWMIFGYYVTEMILYGNHAKAMLSIPGNITQIVIGLVIGVPIAKILRKYIKSNI